MNSSEKTMFGVFVLALVSWATRQLHDIGGTSVIIVLSG